MTRRSSAAVLRQIETLFTAGSCSGLSDRQLLVRFVAHRDAVAELGVEVPFDDTGSEIGPGERARGGPNNGVGAGEIDAGILQTQ